MKAEGAHTNFLPTVLDQGQDHVGPSLDPDWHRTYVLYLDPVATKEKRDPNLK